MNTIQVRVPKAIGQLVEGEQDRLLRVALRMAAKTRAKELTQAQREASTNVVTVQRLVKLVKWVILNSGVLYAHLCSHSSIGST